MDPIFRHMFDICFMFFDDLDFYTKTTDVEFDMQITALSGPRACLGHLNHYEQSSIFYEKITQNEVLLFRFIFKKPFILLGKIKVFGGYGPHV